MNLAEYIKNIDAFLLNEEFAEGTSEDMQNKIKELEAIKKEFLAFLEEIKAKGIELKTIQAKLKESETSSPTPPEEPQPPATSDEKPTQGKPDGPPPAAPAEKSAGTPPQGKPAEQQ